MEQVRVIQSDTKLVPDGVAGTYASRTLQLVGSAVLLSAEKIIATAKEIAQELLEVAAGDLTVGTGGLRVVGVPGAGVSWAAIAAAAEDRGVELAEEQLFESELNTYPFGAHVAVVEVDMETGWARLVRHVAVDDCGTVINPMLALGQQHGGVSQGVGQALLETIRYDGEGNPLTTNLTSYLIPTAVDLPSIEASRTTTPTPVNPLGAKGIGEAGTLGSTPAVHSAVLDALAPLGIRHIDMPLTPARIWDAISAAG
jgi:carbon-monoxide dehydrogenase large subunit